MSNFYLADHAFSKGARRVRADPPPATAAGDCQVEEPTLPDFDSLVGKSLDKFDIGAFVPTTAASGSGPSQRWRK